MTKLKQIGVSTLMKYLFPELLSNIPDYYLQIGSMVHRKLGYTNAKAFARKFKNYLILGVPDLIEEDVIVELKTYFTRNGKKKTEERADVQANIYCWLSGFRYYRVDTYNYQDGKLNIGEVKKANYKRAMKSLEEAIERKEKIEKILKGE